MAYTYSYTLGENIGDNAPDLQRFAQPLGQALAVYFEGHGYHLRDVSVTPRGYEFRVMPDIADKALLRTMGSQLKRAPGLAPFYAACGRENSHYFTAEPRQYAAYVRGLPDGSVYMDVADATEVDESSVQTLASKAMFFAQNGPGAVFTAAEGPGVDVDDILAVLRGDDEEPQTTGARMQRNRAVAAYLSVFIARVYDKKLCQRLLAAAELGGGWVCFAGTLRRGEKTAYGTAAEIVANPDAPYLDFTQNTQLAMEETYVEIPEYLSALVIGRRSIAPAPPTVVRALEALTELGLAGCDGIPAPVNLPAKSYWQLRVHDVGQGLAISLGEQMLDDAEHGPLLYFDFGMDLWRRPARKRDFLVLPCEEGTPIILSHAHTDHWWAVQGQPSAFRARWYLPRQRMGLPAKNLFANVLAQGGSVYLVDSTMQVAEGLTVHPCAGNKNKPHESGLCVLLDLGTEDEPRRALLPGDAEYPHLPPACRQGLSLLVASHHGGSYGGTQADIPAPAKAEAVVYSYGRANPYKHPSRALEYMNAGWGAGHHTAAVGDFVWP